MTDQTEDEPTSIEHRQLSAIAAAMRRLLMTAVLRLSRCGDTAPAGTCSSASRSQRA